MPKRSGSSARGVQREGLTTRTFPSRRPSNSRRCNGWGGPRSVRSPGRLIAILVDPRVLDSFRREARLRRVGCQTLINEVLAQHVRKDVT